MQVILKVNELESEENGSCQERKLIREGKTHLQFCMTLYKIQIENGMYFLHEHPYSASSWKEPCVEEVMSISGVRVIRGDMCAFGMWQDSDNSDEGKELVMKPTGFMTNAEGIARELDEKCDGYHQHVKYLTEERAGQRYTQMSCALGY